MGVRDNEKIHERENEQGGQKRKKKGERDDSETVCERERGREIQELGDIRAATAERKSRGSGEKKERKKEAEKERTSRPTRTLQVNGPSCLL